MDSGIKTKSRKISHASSVSEYSANCVSLRICNSLCLSPAGAVEKSGIYPARNQDKTIAILNNDGRSYTLLERQSTEIANSLIQDNSGTNDSPSEETYHPYLNRTVAAHDVHRTSEITYSNGSIRVIRPSQNEILSNINHSSTKQQYTTCYTNTSTARLEKVSPFIENGSTTDYKVKLVNKINTENKEIQCPDTFIYSQPVINVYQQEIRFLDYAEKVKRLQQIVKQLAQARKRENQVIYELLKKRPETTEHNYDKILSKVQSERCRPNLRNSVYIKKTASYPRSLQPLCIKDKDCTETISFENKVSPLSSITEAFCHPILKPAASSHQQVTNCEPYGKPQKNVVCNKSMSFPSASVTLLEFQTTGYKNNANTKPSQNGILRESVHSVTSTSSISNFIKNHSSVLLEMEFNKNDETRSKELSRSSRTQYQLTEVPFQQESTCYPTSAEARRYIKYDKEYNYDTTNYSIAQSTNRSNIKNAYVARSNQTETELRYTDRQKMRKSFRTTQTERMFDFLTPKYFKGVIYVGGTTVFLGKSKQKTISGTDKENLKLKLKNKLTEKNAYGNSSEDKLFILSDSDILSKQNSKIEMPSTEDKERERESNTKEYDGKVAEHGSSNEEGENNYCSKGKRFDEEGQSYTEPNTLKERHSKNESPLTRKDNTSADKKRNEKEKYEEKFKSRDREGQTSYLMCKCYEESKRNLKTVNFTQTCSECEKNFAQSLSRNEKGSTTSYSKGKSNTRSQKESDTHFGHNNQTKTQSNEDKTHTTQKDERKMESKEEYKNNTENALQLKSGSEDHDNSSFLKSQTTDEDQSRISRGESSVYFASNMPPKRRSNFGMPYAGKEEEMQKETISLLEKKSYIIINSSNEERRSCSGPKNIESTIKIPGKLCTEESYEDKEKLTKPGYKTNTENIAKLKVKSEEGKTNSYLRDKKPNDARENRSEEIRSYSGFSIPTKTYSKKETHFTQRDENEGQKSISLSGTSYPEIKDSEEDRKSRIAIVNYETTRSQIFIKQPNIDKKRSSKEEFEKIASISNQKLRSRHEQGSKYHYMKGIENKLDQLLISVNTLIAELRNRKENYDPANHKKSNDHLGKETRKMHSNVTLYHSKDCITRQRYIPLADLNNLLKRQISEFGIETENLTNPINTNMKKILEEEMGKSNRAKKCIEDILNGEPRSQALQINFDAPTRERSTEISPSLSKTKIMLHGDIGKRNRVSSDCVSSSTYGSCDICYTNIDARNKGDEEVARTVSIQEARCSCLENMTMDNLITLSVMGLYRLSTQTISRIVGFMQSQYFHMSPMQLVARHLGRPTQFVCNVCNKVFRNSVDYTNHMQNLHASIRHKDCCVCRHVMDVARLSTTTGRRHTGLFSCRHCGKIFTRAYCCELHQQTCARRLQRKPSIVESLTILR